MDELLAILFGQAGTPVRRDVRLHSTRDQEGDPHVEALGGEAFYLSPEGSIDRLELTLDRFFGGCGCTTNVQVGGMCSEPGCGRISCNRCFTRCSLCLKSLCLECVTRIQTEDGARDLCHACADEFQWKSLPARLSLGLLPPPKI